MRSGLDTKRFLLSIAKSPCGLRVFRNSLRSFRDDLIPLFWIGELVNNISKIVFPRLPLLLSFLANFAIWHFIWIVAIFYLGSFDADRTVRFIVYAGGIWATVALLALALQLSWYAGPIRLIRAANAGEEISSTRLLQTLRACLALPLRATLMFAAAWLIGWLALAGALVGEGLDLLSSTTVSVGGLAGFIAVPMNIYGMFTNYLGPLTVELSKRASERDLVIAGHGLALRKKLMIAFSLFPLGYTVWLGGMAFYTGMNEGLREARRGAENAIDHVLLNSPAPADELFVASLRQDLARVATIYESEFFLYGADQTLLFSSAKNDKLFFSDSARGGANPKLASAIRDGSYYDAENDVLGVCKAAGAYTLCASRDARTFAAYLPVFLIWMAIFVLAALLVGGILSFYFSTTIARSVQRLTGMVGYVEQGDLSRRTGVESLDEIGQLSQVLSRFFARLASKVEDIRSIARRVEGQNGRLASTANGFAEGAQNQAAATEQASASVEEMNAAIEEVAQKVREQSDTIGNINSVLQQELKVLIEELSEQTGRVKISAANSMERAVQADNASREAIEGMRRIVNAADNIMKMLGIINEIAERTTLLALNASIEAARAGDAGRGFAVVADEISSLADRSSKAAREIEKLLRISTESVHSGTERVTGLNATIGQIREEASHVNASGDTMQDLAVKQADLNARVQSALLRIDEMVRAVATSQDEQGRAATEMMNTVGSMSGSAQQTSDHSASMVQSVGLMAEEAKLLARTVEEFRIAAG